MFMVECSESMCQNYEYARDHIYACVHVGVSVGGLIKAFFFF